MASERHLIPVAQHFNRSPSAQRRIRGQQDVQDDPRVLPLMGLKQGLKPGQDRAALKLENGVGPSYLQGEGKETIRCAQRSDPGNINAETLGRIRNGKDRSGPFQEDLLVFLRSIDHPGKGRGCG